MRIRYSFALTAVLLFAAAAFVMLPSEQLLAWQGDDSFASQSEPELQREIRLAQERVRLLYTQGKYDEAIIEAENLLELEPTNSTAIYLKEQAEAHLASGQTGPPNVSGSGYGPLSNPEEFSQPVQINYEPVPLQSRSSSRRGNVPFYMNPTIQLSVGAGILIFALLLLILWRRSRDNAPAYAGSGSSVIADMPTVSGEVTESPLADMPTHAGTGVFDEQTSQQTAVGDQVTQSERTHVDEEEYVAPPLAAEASEEEERLAGSLSDQQPEARRPMPTEDMVLPPSMDDEGDGLLAVDGFDSKEEQMAANALRDPEEKQDGLSLGIDYNDTDAPMTESQADDIYQTAPHSIKNVSSEPVVDDSIADDMTLAATPLRESQAEPPVADDNQDDILPPVPDEEQTIDISSPAASASAEDVEPPAADEEEDFNIAAVAPPTEGTGTDMSFNSLMFGGDETKMTGGNEAQPDQPTSIEQVASSEGEAPEESDDLTRTSFNNEFNSLMFGADETVTPGMENEGGSEEAAEEQDMEQTVQIGDMGPGEDDMEKTAAIAGGSDDDDDLERTAQVAPKPAAAGAGGKKPSMFDRQRNAGKEALEKKDYARAVQCLSVAASLKPSDKEVRELLEEARELRRG